MNHMMVMHYANNQSAGNSVLIAQDGRVAFLEGQPTKMELAEAFASANFTDDPEQVARAKECKGEELAMLVLKKADARAEDLPSALREMLAEALAGMGAEAQVAEDLLAQANTQYRHAVAMNLLTMLKQDDMDKAVSATERHITSSHPMVGLLVRTLDMGRLAMTHAQRELLDVQTEVVERLHTIAQGEPGQAHAAVVALLDWMGMPVGTCACCGEPQEGHAPGANAEGYTGHAHVPGSGRVH